MNEVFVSFENVVFYNFGNAIIIVETIRIIMFFILISGMDGAYFFLYFHINYLI